MVDEIEGCAAFDRDTMVVAGGHMTSLLVHVPNNSASSPVNLQLRPGETARFGRGAAGCPVEIVLPDPAVPRLAGEILATDSYWLLSNLNSHVGLLVENPEGGGEYVRVPPRRLAAPIPFEFGRVVLATRSGVTGFQVIAPRHAYADPDEIAGRPGAATIHPFSLNEGALYFLVLVALCEPRLRDVPNAGVPTTPQVVARLQRHPDHATITASAVNFHMDYLADSKLHIRPSGDGGRQDSRRETLVTAALRFGIVQEHHLDLLPARHSTGTAS
jgi:serine/threonine-protein kinase